MASNELTARMSQLSAAKRALLEKRLQRQTEFRESDPQTIRPRERRRPLPLSYAQQRLWFIDQLEPGSPIYNIPTALRLSGALNVDALTRCLNEIVRRHESLRTTFNVGHDLQPVQVIAPQMELTLRLEDLSALPEAEREAEAERLATEEAQRGFDLRRGPLLRATLLRLGAEEHILLFTMHHIVSDGWSMGVLVGEVAAVYGAYARGRRSPLPELEVQYADFALWQREWLQGEVLEEQLSFWKRQLGGELPVMSLPTDRQRPPVSSHRGRDVSFKLSREVSDGLKRLSQGEGVTLFMTLMAAYKLLLSRHTGLEDILVGTPIANRNRVETEPLIGFFVNTLVMRTDLSGNPPFRELLRRVKKTALDAYAHQDLPFEKLVEELHPRRDLSRNALFQVLLALQNAPMGDLELHDLTVRAQELDRGTARLDLEFHLHDVPDGISGVMSYNEDIFEGETVRQMLERFKVLLEGVIARPDARLSELPVLTAEERRRLLDEWAAAPGLTPSPAPTVHSLFEAQAGRAPEATALVCGEHTVSYAELDRRAASLARRLRVLGAGPEVRVGLLLRRSVGQLVGLLGVLKAGGAYVPLDPSAPAGRIAFVLRDAGVRLVVTEAELAGSLPAGEVTAVIVGDDGVAVEPDAGSYEEDGGGRDGLRARAAGEAHEAAGEAREGNAAYVVYTSGSTGAPKGVVVSHGSLTGAILAQLAQPEAEVTGTLLQMSYAFDGSLLSIFCALTQGATLVLPREEQQADAGEAARLIKQWELSHLYTVPSFYALLLEQARDGQLDSLRVVTVGAEACPPHLVGKHFEAAPHARLFNEYGPTEATIYCAAHECRPEDAARTLVPVGRPTPGTRLYVLDNFLEPAPTGVSGELYVGGRGLARAYLGRPELTAERFVPDAFGAEAGGRLYRTGDVARWLACGELELAGRLDEQLKVRGYRVEPGEVEAALCAHAGVREAVVLAGRDGAGGARLVAYVAAGGGSQPSAGELREHLSGQLPDYMVPGVYVFVEALPRTATGKVDRRALPAPEPGRDTLSEGFVEPRTEAEKMMARLWGEVLDLESVGREDNFFELGGHSLLATQLISRIRESFGVELPLRSIFESPTVEGLARRVEAGVQAGGAPSQSITPVARESRRVSARSAAAPPARQPAPEARDDGLPLSFAQQRLWFIHQLEPSSAAYNLPVAVRLRGRLDRPALVRTLSEIVRRHESLRTSFPMRGGQPVQRIAPPETVNLHVLDLGHLPEQERGAEAQRQVVAESRRPFDLEHGPLYRAGLLRLGPEEHILLLTMHHIVSDGWSMGVLVGEVGTLYNAFARGLPSPLPPLPIQYADFTLWQRRHLTGEVLEDHRQYWKRQLGGTLPVLELPTDRPRPQVQSFRGGSETLRLPPELVQGLRALAQREGVTLFMLLLAAFKVLLHRYTSQEDIIVGSPIANRNRKEVEGLIGFFVNTLVLRTDLSGRPSFRELLRRVRAVSLEAYAHQDMPFEQLVELLQPERSTSRSPLFQVMFLLQKATSAGASLPGLTLQPVASEHTTAQFDLSFDLLEAEDQIMAVAEYSTDLFDGPTVARMLGHFQSLLEGVVGDPGARLEELPLLARAERERLLLQWSGRGQEGRPAGESLPQLFEARVAAAPDSPAVVGGGEQLTYAELNRRANQLAHHLRALGAGPEARVAVLLERSPEMLVGVLAVLKAGGAYVPLDPRSPKAHLAFMLEDSQASVLLTRTRLADLIPVHPARVVRLDADADVLARQATHDPAPSAAPENLAYLIYTSGSTGRPKGVGVTHRSLVNHQAAVGAAYELRAGDRVFQSASLSFDVAAEEIFPTLLGGAALVLRDGRAPDFGAGLLRQVEEDGVTVLNLPASAWHEWVGELSRRKARLPDCLRLVVVGSEPVSRVIFDAWRGLAGDGARLLNAYGTTETTITATLYRPAAGEGETYAAASLPIGRPVVGARAYVLDPLMQPVPVGVAGQLHVGGPCLARGYLGRPALTAERFVPDPFSAEPGARLYRTGDLVRHLPDGNLEFLGRLDHQLKLRGYRIEPGEIEAVLNEHAGVRRAAVVLTRTGAEGNRQLAAYVATEPGRAVTKNELREYLRERLPEHMVPPAFVLMDELPLTAGGKVDRRALPEAAVARGEAEESALPRSEVERAIAAVWRKALGLERVGVHDNFFDLGGHSLLMVRVHGELREALGADITMLDLFKYPTVSALADFIAPEQSARAEAGARPVRARVESADVAVIGMAGRFPGASSVEQFWQNLREGVESVSVVSDEELVAAGVDPALLAHPNYVKAGVVLDDIDKFDALFFGYSPREAEAMDPQHRLFLECAWEALERAGHDPDRPGGPVGVFAGAGPNTYLYHLYSNPEVAESVGEMQLAILNEKDHLPTHVSYKLNLRGPSVAVQTACSTSLVAVHMACRSLLDGECTMALAGGVTVNSSQGGGYLYHEGGIGSPDGHCRAFDAAAEGTFGASGVAIVVLKRLEDALADGDQIHAVIKGSAVNNDGSAKVGYTAPSVEGQAEVIRAAQAAAGVSPETISYVEAHGTGTRLGDPIEVAALTQVFREGTARKNFCALGTLKTNMGHLDTAAGAGGLIKTVLSLEQRLLPPTLHFERPNPALGLDESPFYVNKDLSEWAGDGSPRRAAVSSFGIGGTNAHVILEEAPAREPSGPSRPWQLLTLSAKTDAALDRMSANLAEHLRRHPELDLADAAYTLKLGRKTFGRRRAVVCREIGDALAALDALDHERVFTSAGEATARDVVFMFPGQGTQYVGMGAGLYRHEPVFREEVDRCCELLRPHLGFDLRDVLYPPGEKVEEAAARLRQTAVTQPALFVVEYALAQLWAAWGLKPSAMIGHSSGEYVAACLAGVFSLEDALALVALRGELMQSLPEGAMLSVPLPEDELRGMLDGRLSLAAVNGPALCAVSGPTAAVEELQKSLAGRGVVCRRLATSHAFHSHMVEPIVERFAARVRGAQLNAPRLRYVSNVTGTWITPAEATDPAYWARHLRETVRFADGARELLQDAGAALIEVGPGQTLTTLVRALAQETGQPVFNSLRHPEGRDADEEFLMKALGRLWLSGAQVDWARFYARESRRRVTLPTYPFERRRYWVDLQKPEAGAGARLGAPRGRKGLSDWFYLPYWKPSVLSAPARAGDPAGRAETWLVFLDEAGLGARVAEQLRRGGAEVVTARGGGQFGRAGGRDYTINVARREDYEALLLDLRSQGLTPGAVLHALCVGGPGQASAGAEFSRQALERSFYSLVFLAQALGRHGAGERTSISVLSTGMQRVTGEELLVPETAAALGPCKVIPLEFPHVTCRSIDVTLPTERGRQEETLVAQVVSEIASDSTEAVVAYRGARRWVQAFEPVRLEPNPSGPARLKEEGVYLITGGLGGVGLVLAEHLARTRRARLVLVGRSALPPRDEWQHWLAAHDGADETSARIRRLTGMENLGAGVLALSADVSDREQMREVLRQARARFGKIDGVIHAAGISPGGMIEVKDAAGAASVLAPKVAGVRVLEELLGDEPLDFLALFSSLSSVIGAFGQVDYCAANSFLNAFAHYNAGRAGTPTIALDWDAWRDVGMAAKAELRFGRGAAAAAAARAREDGVEGAPDAGRAESPLAEAISSEEGIDAFERVLAHDAWPQVLISTRDLQGEISRAAELTGARIIDEIEQHGQTRAAHPRPEMQVAYVAPRDELEGRIAEVWQRVLGIERVGVFDNFFELGGHSLLATQLISRLREFSGAEIPLRVVFETPTVAGLAAHLGQALGEAAPAEPQAIAPISRQTRQVRRPRK